MKILGVFKRGLYGMFILLFLSSCYTKKAVLNFEQSDCYSYLMANKSAWKVDRLGKNGDRVVIAEKLKTLSCSFNGLQWAYIAKFFGQPNSNYKYIENKHNVIEYRYKVNNIERVQKFGQRYLSITLNKKRTVEDFVIWVVDE